MLALIIGTPDSGKSEEAERLAVQLADGGSLFYIATMIPFGSEGMKRVKRHRARRRGKGFVTVECPTRVHELVKHIPDISGGTVLLECMSNLIANEMHEPENIKSQVPVLSESIVTSVLQLSKSTLNTVIVSNRFPLEDEGYDEDTIRYVNIIKAVNDSLSVEADRVININTGDAGI